MDCNPYLAPEAAHGRGSVEKPENIEWQTRAAPPSEYENRLGAALEQAFAGGAQTLAEVVSALNELQLPDHDGGRWTEASFEQAMQRLGA